MQSSTNIQPQRKPPSAWKRLLSPVVFMRDLIIEARYDPITPLFTFGGGVAGAAIGVAIWWLLGPVSPYVRWPISVVSTLAGIPLGLLAGNFLSGAIHGSRGG